MRILLALCALALSTACSGSSDGVEQPPESAFAEGTCRTVAPDVLALGKAAEDLGDERTISRELKTELREAQARLAELAVAAEPQYKPALARLLASTGAVRIRADGNVYEPGLGEQMKKDYRGVIDVCT